MVFLELMCNFWGFSPIKWGTQGASLLAPGTSSLHSSCESERGIALELRRGTGPQDALKSILEVFLQWGGGPWVSSTCDGDLRELLRVPMGSQEYCCVGRGLLGLHWVWCNGRVPHLELRWEPQVSSPVLTWSRAVYAVSNRGSGLDVCGGMELCFPLELSMGFQASRGIEFGTWGSSWISNWGIRTPFLL